MVAFALLCAGQNPVRAGFANVTGGTGINYVHAPAASAVLKGHGGIAALDADGDGWTDLLGARFNATPVLYINQRNGTFREEAAVRGLTVARDAGGFAAGDFDHDGDVDIFIVPQKGNRFFLFINDGTGHFTEQAIPRGAAVTTTLEDHRGFSVGLVDYDRDGYLDVYVSEWGPTQAAERTLHSVLLHNRGAAAPGSFENVTVAAGLVQPIAGKAQQTGFTTAWGDFDGDGWPDLALVSDFGTSRMYWNNGNGTFTETTVASGLGLDEAGMGVAVADYDGDGLLDIYVTSIYDRVVFRIQGTNTGNKLYRNLGGRRFAEVAKTAGVDRTGWGWGTAFFDHDNDGDQDLIATNGMDGVQGGPTLPFWDALTDRTTVFQNDGAGKFVDISEFVGIADIGLGKGLVIVDYDNDGDEDVVIADSYAGPIIYRNEASTNGNRWFRLRFRGTVSNRDGIGAIVQVTSGDKTQTALFNPTNAFIGQREPVLHFGLGAAATTVDAIKIIWPSGTVQNLTGLEVNQVYTVTEPMIVQSAPVIATGPVGGTFQKDQPLVFTVAASGNPAPVYVWQKDGVDIAGENNPTFRISRLHPFDAGLYTAKVINPLGMATSTPVVVNITIDPARHSVARWWNEFLLDGIRKDVPNPPVHARNLYHFSAALWDACWPYEVEGWSQASSVFVRETVVASDWIGGREAAQSQAMSHAAYRVLTERFKNSPGRARTLFGARWLMQQLGCDPDYTGTAGNSPAAVGNRIGFGVLAATRNDGANEAGSYADTTGYVSVNEPMVVTLPSVAIAEPSRWQPLALRHSITQNGIILADGIQRFVGVNARNTTPFALVKTTPTTIALDPGPPPQFGSPTHAAFVQEALDCIQTSAMLDPSDAVTIDISPGAYLNNPLGTNAGTGRSLNPVTGRAYLPNVVRRADYARVLSEFWADGPNSETPPGHWNVVLNEISDYPLFPRRYGGSGPELSRLEWDVRAYLALNGAVHDAACAAWTVKWQYDSARPISMIRYLASLGQSSDPAGPSYHARGLPLVSNLIEVISPQSSAVGQRHAHLADKVGKIAIRAWRGNPVDPLTQTGGVGWILAEQWVPYQLPTFVTPAFPGYVSGHSTFSRAAAEVLTLLTGSPFFPGGLGEYRFKKNEFLTFEIGPSADLTLQWATYYDAADQAGLSRIFGGIHPSIDDFPGRRLGSRVGLEAFLKAQSLRRAAAPPAGLVNVSTRSRAGSSDEVVIAGFVIDGATPQTTLLRAVGPELLKYGVPSDRCDADPRIELHRSSDDATLLSNDNWGASLRAAQIAARAVNAGAFPLTSGSADAAELIELSQGAYSMVVRSSAPEKRGIVLAEVYGNRLANLSTRASVGSGDAVLIAGFVVDAADPTPIVIRSVGPTLAGFGVSRTLGDPILSVYRQLPDGRSELVATNNNWSDNDKASLIQGAAAHAGAFPLASGSKDAALFLQLSAGAYTASVGSADASEGVALVEVYHVK